MENNYFDKEYFKSIVSKVCRIFEVNPIEHKSKIKLKKITFDDNMPLMDSMPEEDVSVEYLKNYKNIDNYRDVFLDDRGMFFVAYKKDNLWKTKGQFFIDRIKSKDLNRVHLKFCGAIQQHTTLRDNLVKTQRMNDFDVTIRENITIKRDLIVCQKCLNEIHEVLLDIGYPIQYKRPWLKYQDQFCFDLELYAELIWAKYGKQPTLLTQRELDKMKNDTAYVGYTPMHRLRKRQLISSRGLRCEQCTVDLSNDRDLLEMHHISSNKSDNNDKNLQLLCYICHEKSDGHKPIENDKVDRIEKLKREQGL